MILWLPEWLSIQSLRLDIYSIEGEEMDSPIIRLEFELFSPSRNPIHYAYIRRNLVLLQITSEYVSGNIFELNKIKYRIWSHHVKNLTSCFLHVKGKRKWLRIAIRISFHSTDIRQLLHSCQLLNNKIYTSILYNWFSFFLNHVFCDLYRGW